MLVVFWEGGCHTTGLASQSYLTPGLGAYGSLGHTWTTSYVVHNWRTRGYVGGFGGLRALSGHNRMLTFSMQPDC